MKYDVSEVLAHYGVTIEREGEEYTVLCPFHDDHKPSGRINSNTGRFNCWACKTNVSLFNYVARRFGKTLQNVFYEVGRLNSTSTRIIEDPTNIEEWHVELFKQKRLLDELKHRCITEENIRYYRLGAWVAGSRDEFIHIPIRNLRGEIIAVKAYAPGKAIKYFWPRRPCNNQRGKVRKLCEELLYPVEQLDYDRILICGGEIKAIAAATVLNPHDIGAISGTGSETTTFTDEQCTAFANKQVYVCYDVDEAGETGAEGLCIQLSSHTKQLYKLTLPLNREEYPKGDINDFLRIGGNLLELINAATLWENVGPAEDVDETEEPLEVDLDVAVRASMAKKRMSIKAVVSSMDTSPYSIPHEIKTACDRGHNYCPTCTIYKTSNKKTATFTLKSERVEVIEMIGQEITKQHNIIKRAFGIPVKCNTVNFTAKSHHHVEDARISQQLDITSRTNERSMQIAYCVGEENKLVLNESYTMIGRMYPHPDNQQAALIISRYETTQDALSTFVPTNLKQLEIFQPVEWTVAGISRKLNEIYDDLEANVTRIFARRNLHLLYDLAYHSPLFLQFDDKIDVKGWTDVLVIGDSSQGKSETINNLILHYGLGEKVVCKGATVAGLMGGVQQYGKRWFASWGKIPTHDRRLIVLEEMKGTSTEVIGKLTDMRSSGIAELTKIEKRRTQARTRLISISNPRSNRSISSYNYGIDSVVELIGSMEDIRRFDAILILAKDEVNVEELQRKRPKLQHVYTSELCRELILLGWTIPTVIFENEDLVLDTAVTLCKTFSEQVPIVDSGSMRYKLARLAAALAVRTLSLKDERSILVRDCHVEYIARFLHKIYSTTAFGYLEYSKAIFKAEQLIDPNAIRLRILNNTPFPKDFITSLLTTDEIDLQTIQDILGWPMADARDLLAFLNRHHALIRKGRAYHKTIGFTKLLKEMEGEDPDGRPIYIPEEF